MKLKPTAVVVMIRTNYSETKTHETHPYQLHNETLEVIAAHYLAAYNLFLFNVQLPTLRIGKDFITISRQLIGLFILFRGLIG